MLMVLAGERCVSPGRSSRYARDDGILLSVSEHWCLRAWPIREHFRRTSVPQPREAFPGQRLGRRGICFQHYVRQTVLVCPEDGAKRRKKHDMRSPEGLSGRQWSGR